MINVACPCSQPCKSAHAAHTRQNSQIRNTPEPCALAGIDPDLIPFTAVLGLVRAHVTAEACCRHCGRRPPGRATRWPASSRPSSPAPATAPDGSGHPAAPPPSAASDTPKKSRTPSRSRSQISHNGTKIRKVKGSGA